MEENRTDYFSALGLQDLHLDHPLRVLSHYKDTPVSFIRNPQETRNVNAHSLENVLARIKVVESLCCEGFLIC